MPKRKNRRGTSRGQQSTSPAPARGVLYPGELINGLKKSREVAQGKELHTLEEPSERPPTMNEPATRIDTSSNRTILPHFQFVFTLQLLRILPLWPKNAQFSPNPERADDARADNPPSLGARETNTGSKGEKEGVGKRDGEGERKREGGREREEKEGRERATKRGEGENGKKGRTLKTAGVPGGSHRAINIIFHSPITSRSRSFGCGVVCARSPRMTSRISE